MLRKEDIEKTKETMQHWIEYEKMNKTKINRADELIKIQETLLQYIQELEISNAELDKENNRLEKIEFERDEVNNKIKKLKDKLKEDIKFFDKTKKLHKTYSPSEERLNAKQHYAEEILEIIGEN